VSKAHEFEVLKALLGSKCRGFLESRCRRLFGARGADASEPKLRWVFGSVGAEALEVEAWTVQWGWRCRGLLELTCGRFYGTGGTAALRSIEKARKLEQVGSLASRGEIARLLIANALEASCWGRDRACVVANSAVNVMSVCSRVNRGQRSGDHLEEHKTRGGERSLARLNHRTSESRLRMEQSLEAEGC
jgi:hypothetical protein